MRKVAGHLIMAEETGYIAQLHYNTIGGCFIIKIHAETLPQERKASTLDTQTISFIQYPNMDIVVRAVQIIEVIIYLTQIT